MEHILQTERETLKFRLLALLVVVLLVVFVGQGQVRWIRITLLSLAYLGYAFLLRGVLMPKLGTELIVYPMILVDTLVITAALDLTGGATSPVFVFFPVAVIYYAIYLGYASSLFAATACSLAYAGYVAWRGPGSLPPVTVGLQIPFFYLLALFSGYLAGKRFQEREEKEALQQLIQVEAGARSLLEMAKRIGQSLEMDAVLQSLVNAAPRLGGLPHCLAALPAEAGLRQEVSDRLRGHAANFPPGELGLKSLEEVVIPRAEARALGFASGPQTPPWAQALSLGAVLTIPLRTEGEPVGAFLLLAREPRPPLSPGEMELARSFGELASGAVANALAHARSRAQVGQLMGELRGAVQRLEHSRQAQERAILEVNGLVIDGPQARVLLEGRPVSLTPKEFDLLYCLAESAGAPQNQETLLRRVWGESYQGQASVVDVSIYRLRRKIEGNPASPTRILTVRGAGYMLASGKPTPPRRRR